MPKTPFRVRCFEFVLFAGTAFVVLTTLAMFLYPGGTAKDHSTHGYSFLVNFFSDLGRLKAHNGSPNTYSAPLFASALGLAGLALITFFPAFAGLLWQSFILRLAAAWGAAMGILSGVCFIGVAATPSDVSRYHGTFVIWAFRLFLFAVLPLALAIFAQKEYPKIGAWLFVAFALLLASYIALLTVGPSTRTSSGLIIQVTGQKLIVYASILCVGLQAALARKFVRAKLQ